jgi:hypothetical protein
MKATPSESTPPAQHVTAAAALPATASGTSRSLTRRAAAPLIGVGEEEHVACASHAGVYESRLNLAPTASAPSLARRHVAEVMRRWGIDLDGLAELVATEVVTNGVKASGIDLDWHEQAQTVDPPFSALRSSERDVAPPIVRLVLMLDPAKGIFVIAVWDRSPQPPIAQSPEPDALGGRGLMLVAGSCETWGWYWPDRPVLDDQPWPSATTTDDSVDEGRHGKVVWARWATR